MLISTTVAPNAPKTSMSAGVRAKKKIFMRKWGLLSETILISTKEKFMIRL